MLFVLKKAFINSCKQGENSLNDAPHKRITLNIVRLPLKNGIKLNATSYLEPLSVDLNAV